MSAFVCSAEQFCYLVMAAIPRTRDEGSFGWGSKLIRHSIDYMAEEDDTDTLDRMVNILKLENVTSVNHLYKGRHKEEFEKIKFVRLGRRADRLDPVVVLKQIDFYEYQSCEHPEWEDSEAYQFVNALRLRWIKNLPGWYDAPWGIG
jgi:hypothetical protein